MFGGPFEQRARLFGRVGRDFHQHPSPFQLLRAARLTTGKWGRQRHTNMSACRVFYKSLAMHFSYVMRQPNPQKGLCTTIDSPTALPIQGKSSFFQSKAHATFVPKIPRAPPLPKIHAAARSGLPASCSTRCSPGLADSKALRRAPPEQRDARPGRKRQAVHGGALCPTQSWWTLPSAAHHTVGAER